MSLAQFGGIFISERVYTFMLQQEDGRTYLGKNPEELTLLLRLEMRFLWNLSVETTKIFRLPSIVYNKWLRKRVQSACWLK